MRLDDLKGRRVAVLGLGVDVRAALPALAASDPTDIVAVDEGFGATAAGTSAGVSALRDPARLMDLGEAAGWAEIFVRSPGFPRYRPELQAALARGARMTTPLDLWMGTFGRDRTVIGVTGTKGKSTVTELTGVLASGAGLRVGRAGNVGVPVFDDGWDHEAPVIVLEVSSYQAADLHHVPDVAVISYLSEDHLSWHGGVEAYVADKLRMVRTDGQVARRVLVPPEAGRALEALAALGVEPEIVPVPEADPSLPRHRVANAALAAAALEAAGGVALSADAVLRAAGSSLPGRLDVCAGPDGLLCVDDALASNPSATAAGLAWLRAMGRPAIVLLGGAGRGVDPAPLVEEVDRWTPGMLHCVTLPENGPSLAERCSLPVLAAATDISEATLLALAASMHDGVVLFSPAAPTLPRDGNWRTRSDAFRAVLAGARAT